MPPVTLSTVVDLAKIKMKWKEQYVSEGLNKKIVPFAAGIYHGLKLVQNITSSRLVSVSAGSDTKHAAVYESATGFSLTYFDVAGASVTLDLSDAALDNQETVIALSITYTIGADTTASWIAYPIADWNALTAAQQAERIVLGTVNVPAPATNITTAMITPDRRTVAWETEAPGAVAWSPVLRNPSFEHGVTGADTVDFSISDWWNRTNVASNGSFRLGTTTVRSGAKSLELFKASAAGTDAEIQQYCEVPVVPGQLIKFSVWIRQLLAPSAPTEIKIFLTFGDADSVQLPHLSYDMAILGATDAAFRNFSKTIEAPAGAYVLKRIALQADGVECGSGGVAFVLDDVQVFVEAGSPTAIAANANARLQQKAVYAMIFEEPTGYSVGQLAALMTFTDSLPASEGSLLIDRKDKNYAGANLPPAVDHAGRLFLGRELLATETKALLPRVTAVPSTTVGVDYTLMWESRPTGLRGYRKYVSAAGALVETFNAVWGGTTWSKDQNGAPAIKWETANGTSNFRKRDSGNDTPWSDGAWDSLVVNFDLVTPAATLPATTIEGNATVQANSHVIVSGTGLYKRGTRVRVYDALHAELVSFYPSVYDRDLIDFFSGTSLLFWQQSGQQFRIPIHMEEGERLTEVRAYTFCGTTDTINMKLFRSTITVGNNLAGTSVQVGATQTSTNHTSIIEQLTISGIAEDATAPGTVKSWAVELGNPAFLSGPICAGIAVYTTIP